ncbi:MAG: CDP-alcohol phosphatidyltransferase family protein [Candidatus Acidiferrales bacterium]
MSVEQMPLETAYGNEVKRAEPANPPKQRVAAGFRNALRIQESLTAAPERKVLLWLAERMPAHVNSDHLTLLGFAATILAGASYAMARWNRAGLLSAAGCLALNWFGDSLDGTIARVRNSQRPRYGFYVDHMIDSIGALLLMGGLAASGYLDERIGMGMLAAFLLLSIETYLATYTMGTFRMSFWIFGPTEIRILLAMGSIALWLHPDARIPRLGYRLFDFGGIVAIAGMGAMLAIAAARHTAQLYREETRP